MLALTAQTGDLAIRTDLNKTFVLAASPASTLANWAEVLAPTAAVSSVAGRTGAVVLAKADVGLGNVDNTSDPNKPVSTAQAVALAAKLGTGLHTISLPAGAFTPRTTSGASTSQEETTTNKRMVRTLDFDASTIEYAQCIVAMPKSWNKGTFTAKILWAPLDGTAGNVVWNIRAACMDPYDSTDNLDRAWGSAVANTSPAPGGATYHAYSDVGAVTPGGTPGDNSLLSIELYRDASNASDTYAADAKVIAVQLFVTINAATDA